MNGQQRGVALLIVLLVIALMVVIAANVSERNGRAYLSTIRVLEQQQAKWYGLSVEALVGKILLMDGKDSPEKTHLAQFWAQERQPFPVDGAEVLGSVTDGQACFNLNTVNQGASEAATIPTDPYPAQVFRQLLQNLGEDPVSARQITAALRNWVDRDQKAQIDGAEDEAYASLASPYLPANQPLIDVSELRSVLGVSASIYQRLLPYVCVLPVQTLRININTIAESRSALLTALFLNQIDSREAVKLIKERPREGWSSVAAFLSQESLQAMNSEKVRRVLTVKSDLFFANVTVRMGDTDYQLRSVLNRGVNDIKVVQRQYRAAVKVEP